MQPPPPPPSPKVRGSLNIKRKRLNFVLIFLLTKHFLISRASRFIWTRCRSFENSIILSSWCSTNKRCKYVLVFCCCCCWNTKPGLFAGFIWYEISCCFVLFCFLAHIKNVTWKLDYLHNEYVTHRQNLENERQRKMATDRRNDGIDIPIDVSSRVSHTQQHK